VYCDCGAIDGQYRLFRQEMYMQKITTFLESVKIELGKVTWPTRKETVATTGVVVMIVFLISLYLGACDIILSRLMRLILG
jgi:preprotein translocase subunit SecE